MLYLILLLEAMLSKSMPMIRYIMYKNNLNNVGDQGIPKIVLNYSQNHLLVKRGWLKDVTTWLKYSRIEESITVQNINNIKNSITFMWCKEDFEVKRKLGYYKEIINPNFEDQNYLFILTKTPLVEKTCHLYQSMNIEEKKHFL